MVAAARVRVAHVRCVVGLHRADLFGQGDDRERPAELARCRQNRRLEDSQASVGKGHAPREHERERGVLRLLRASIVTLLRHVRLDVLSGQ